MKKAQWSAPKLRTLDIEETLSSPSPANAEDAQMTHNAQNPQTNNVPGGPMTS